MLLGHIGEMDLEMQTLITNIFSEYWAFNNILVFTDYTTSQDHNPFRRLPKDFSAFSFGKEMWLDLMVSSLSFFIFVAYFLPLERLCLTIEVFSDLDLYVYGAIPAMSGAEAYRQARAEEDRDGGRVSSRHPVRNLAKHNHWRDGSCLGCR